MMTKKAYSETTGVSVPTIDGWIRRYWLRGIHYNVIGHQTVIDVEAANQMGHSLNTFNSTCAEWIDAFAKPQDMSRFDGIAVDRILDWERKERLVRSPKHYL